MSFPTIFIRRWILRAAGLMVLGGVLWAMPLLAQEQPPAEKTQAAPISIWSKVGLEDFKFTDRTGETITKQNLLGKEWAIGFMFSRCRGPCPILIGEMKQLQEQTGVNMVVFTVDPEVDTPELLKRFSAQYVPAAKPDAKGETPKWYWLTGDKDQIIPYIRRNFLVPAMNENGQPDHSNLVMHVDETGHVLGKYLGTDSAEMTLLRRIIQKKAPRGQMMTAPIPKGAFQVEGAPPGFTFIRPAEQPDEAGETGDRTVSNSGETGAETPNAADAVPGWVRNLPSVNAGLNGLATILLVIGYVLIKTKHVHAHKAVMLSCFATSIVFLCSYCIYHAFVLSKKFPGTGAIRTLYFTILITHVILAATVPVLASMTIYRALTQQWARHKSIARVTFPIWLYVSVTGVIIYFMLYQWPVA
jgi:protein SCO1/2